MTRRGLLTGLVALIAAPAIVRAASIMPVRGVVMPIWPPLMNVGEIPDDLYGISPFMIYLEHARDEVVRVRIAAIPPEQFYRTD